jgi:hypothetical protein
MMTMTNPTMDTNVVPFKNIGTFVEELAAWAGDKEGYFGVQKVNEDLWRASLTIDNDARTLVKDGDTFNNAVLALWRTTVKLAQGM